MLEDFAKKHAIKRAVRIRKCIALYVEVLKWKIDPLTFELDAVNRCCMDGVVAEVIREKNLKRMAESPPNEQRHQVGIRTELQHSTDPLLP